ncbi:hypothetical protein MASR2M117_13950 [Paludibacter sp.]
MFVFSPTDNMANIRTTINTIHDQMFHDEFSTKRYAFYFKPGDYTQAGLLNLAYYGHIGGLGKSPYEVKISNVYTPAPLPNNNATCTFWRSAENFTVAGKSTGDMNTWFQWAVSQAAPLRRINSEKRAHYQWWYDGWCSGGFTGDCNFQDRAGSWSQQQWYFRNTYVELGSKDYSAGGWNLCYQGVEYGPSVNMTNHSDNWNISGGAWNNVSRVDKTPVIREKPFLFLDDDGRYKIFKPALRYDSKGISWSKTNMGEGEIFDLVDDFFVVKPGASAQTMNEQLDLGKHLFITPGIYELSEPLHVKYANTIILGTGYATLIPSQTNTNSAIIIDDVDGVTVASLLFDANTNSRTLLQVGEQNSMKNHSNNPTLLADLFFRVGGYFNYNVNVDIALEINSSDVIGDHFWIWRADHGKNVGWFKNTAKNGLIVNGHYVTIYGLFNEHFQEYGTIWNGEKGRMYFYQNETPYDVINQNDYMSHNGTVEGYAQYKVPDHVNYHEAYMLGLYDVFINTQGAKIGVENSIEVSKSKEVKVHHACNVRISSNNMGGFKNIINNQYQSTYYTNKIANRYYVIDFNGGVEPEEWERPEELNSGIIYNSVHTQLSLNYNSHDQSLYIKHPYEGSLQLYIVNATGQVVYNHEYITSVSLQKLPTGVYGVFIYSDNKLMYKTKILKTS